MSIKNVNVIFFKVINPRKNNVNAMACNLENKCCKSSQNVPKVTCLGKTMVFFVKVKNNTTIDQLYFNTKQICLNLLVFNFRIIIFALNTKTKHEYFN